MISANLQQWIQHPETLNKDTLYELRTLVTRYPYFQSLRLLYLKNLYLLHDISFGAELRKAILYVADRRKLFYLIEGERYILKPRKKNMPSEAEVLEEEPGLDRTLSLIDAFLATVPEEVSGQTSLDYSTDYTTYLLQEDEEDSAPEQSEIPKLRGYELIDGFILMVIAAILMCFIVLIQNSKGGGLASGFSSSNQIMGVRKTTDFLEKATWGLAAFMVVMSIATAYVVPTSSSKTQDVIMEQAQQEEQTNPYNLPVGTTAPKTDAAAPAEAPATETPATPAN